jgi:hypothetical protein
MVLLLIILAFSDLDWIQTSNLRGYERDEKINIYEYFLGNMLSLYFECNCTDLHSNKFILY